MTVEHCEGFDRLIDDRGAIVATWSSKKAGSEIISRYFDEEKLTLKQVRELIAEINSSGLPMEIRNYKPR